jgi:hypothetical protein
LARHQHTQALLRAASRMPLGRRSERVALAGELSSLMAPFGMPMSPAILLCNGTERSLS